MRYQLNSNLRSAIIILLPVILGVLLFFGGRTLTMPGTVEEKVPQYSYNQQARVQYRVYLVPNNLYRENVLDEGQVYIANYVDYINTFFTYRFSGDQAADVKGEYDAVAVVEAISGEGEKQRIVWQREFTLLPKTAFSSNGNEVSVQKELPIKLQEYIAFVEQVIEESKFNPGILQMTVCWNVTLEAQTESGLVREELTPTMIVPLKQSAFEIGGENKIDKPGAIEEVRQVPAPVNTNRVVLFGAVAGLCGFVLIFILIFTVPVRVTDPVQKKVKEIFRKHGDRIAYIEGEMPTGLKNNVSVKSIEDLVRIADELGRPIMYKLAFNAAEKPSFFVFDEPEMYVFELKVVPKINQVVKTELQGEAEV